MTENLLEMLAATELGNSYLLALSLINNLSHNLSAINIRSANLYVVSISNHQYLVEFDRCTLLSILKKLNGNNITLRNLILFAASQYNCVHLKLHSPKPVRVSRDKNL